jgi:hypothetical protein
MRLYRLLISCALSAFVCAASAQAEVVLGNLGNQGTGTAGTSGYGVPLQTPNIDVWLAIPFRTGSFATELTDVVVGMRKSAGVGGLGIYAYLHADNNGVPGSRLGWADDVYVNTGYQTWTYSDDPFQLATATDYWILLQAGSVWEWLVADPSATPTAQTGSGWSYPAGGALLTTNNGTSWSSVGQQNSFSVGTVVVPEPATLALAAFAGLGGLASLRLRRRKRQA